MLFARIWHLVRGKRRQPTSALMFRRAQSLRDEGSYRRAAGLVDEALLHDPSSVVGHLLAASLHMVLRETGQARTSFERVLVLEPTQPRALLGVAQELLATAEATRDATSNGALHADRLRLPVESREALFMRADATVI